MIAQDMVAVRLTPPFQAIMVAAPGYLAARGAVVSVGDLRRHNCIGFRRPTAGGVYAWELRDAGKDVEVGVRGTVLLTDPTYARELAIAGVGIAYVFEPLVRDDLLAGRLVQVLPEAAIMEPGLFVYFPGRLATVPKLRAFLDVGKRTFSA
jgi:DNA-binding transcriptional LysR family regulator